MKKTVLLLVFCLVLGILNFEAFAETAVISFDSIDSEGFVSEKDFTVSVSGTEVASVELLIDGISQGTDTEAPFTFTLEQDTLGSHTALAIVKAADNTYTQAQKNFTVIEYVDVSTISYDYESFTETADTYWTVRPNGSTQWNFWGSSYRKVGSQDNGFGKPGSGKCIRYVTSDGDPDFAATSIYTRFRVPSKPDFATRLHFETDFFASGMSEGIGTFLFTTECTYNGSRSTDTHAFYDYRGLTINGTVYPLAQDTWHHLVFEYDYATKEISAWTNGTQIVNKEVIEKNRVGTSFYWYRINYSDPGGEVRLDNSSLNFIIKSPYCEGIASDGAELADYTASDASLKLNIGITALDTSKVKLTNEIGDVPLAAVNYSADDSTITLIPEHGFEPSNEYILILPLGTEFSSVGGIKKPLRIKFKTSPCDIDVVNGRINLFGQSASFETELSNTSDGDITAVAYITVYKDGIAKQYTKSSPVLITSGATSVKCTTPTLEVSEGDNIKAFVADSTGKLISDKIYILEYN